ncbi:MAG: hypothetical protein M3Q29_11445 [Chloroflexota bacterium]|nr:hypothetical protein [Chloroflexota bacterium]
MKALTEQLLAAQKERTQRPYIQWLTATSRRWGAHPLAATPIHSEAGDAAQFAACIAADGSLCRMRILANGDLLAQRITDPVSPAGWGAAWSLLGAGVASSSIPPSMVSGSTTVNMGYVRPDGVTVVRRVSTNNGVSWTGENLVAADTAAPVRAVALAARAGTNDRFFLWAAGAVQSGASTVELRYRMLTSSGTYGAITSATVPKFRNVEGLTCVHNGDWHVAITGQSGQGEYPWGVFLTLMGDGYSTAAGNWLGLGTLQRADSDTGYRFYQPSLASITGTEHCSYWAGRPGGPDRLEIAHRVFSGYGISEWTAPAPVGVVSVPALLISGPSATEALLAGERSGWAVDTAARTLELSGRLRSYCLQVPGALRLVLSDADGASRSAELELLRPGAGIRLSRGLHTPGGPLSAGLPEQEVAEVRRVEEAGERMLLVECRDALLALSAYRANRSFAWDRTHSIHVMLAELTALAGLKLSLAASPSAQATHKPSFAVAPGESTLAAARRLLDQVPERLRPSGDGLVLVDPSDTAAPAYSYGYGGQPLLSWELASGPLEPNHVQAYGKRGTTVYGEAMDPEAVTRLGQRLVKLLDPSLADNAEATALAEAMLAAARRRARTGRLRSMPNLGLELWDRVDIYPYETALPETRTVTSFEERYDPGKGEWLQDLTFGEE